MPARLISFGDFRRRGETSAQSATYKRDRELPILAIVRQGSDDDRGRDF